MAGSLSRNISLKVPNPTKVSVHVAGSLNQNYTWRDHSDGITRGGITQSEYFPKGPQSHRGLSSRGGITQSEFSYKSLQLEVCRHTPKHQVAGPLSLNYMWQDLNIFITVPISIGVSTPGDHSV